MKKISSLLAALLLTVSLSSVGLGWLELPSVPKSLHDTPEFYFDPGEPGVG